MKVTHYPSGAALLRSAGAHLEEHEAENGLILGLCSGKSDVPESSYVSVEDSGAVIAVAVRTPPFNLVLSNAPRAALEALADDLSQRKVVLPGISCRSEVGDVFAELWSARTGRHAKTTMRQGVYALTRVIPPRPTSGALRPARAADEPLLASWMLRFAEDASLPASEAITYQRRLPTMIEAGTIFVWDDGAPVSMAFLQGATPHGIRVSMVFTPKDARGHGYASACVAAMSEHALASGRRFCMLYTDLANPTSNAIYQRLGYELVCEAVMIEFSEREP